jgi:hypothetical protein
MSSTVCSLASHQQELLSWQMQPFITKFMTTEICLELVLNYSQICETTEHTELLLLHAILHFGLWQHCNGQEINHCMWQ